MSTPYFEENKQGVLYILELETTLPYAYWSVCSWNNWEGAWVSRPPAYNNAGGKKKKPKERFLKIGYSTRKYDDDRYETRKWQFERQGLRIVDECRVYEMRDPWHSLCETDLHNHWREKFGYMPMWQGFSGYTECYVPELKQELDVIDDMVRVSVNRKIDETIIQLEEDRNVWNN